MVDLIPITKINEPQMRDISKLIPAEFVVIRLLDLISSTTFNLNETFYKIKEGGGLHKYLNCDKKIIFSLIVRDNILANLTTVDYAFIINSIKPDFFTTPDCETYNNEETLAIEEIKKSIIQTKELIDLCPNSKPIGHVKGCNERLVEQHTKMLNWLGIEDFIFHTGDFLRQADRNMIIKARNFASKIKPYARHLFLYGMGSQNDLIKFSFADTYITNSHFVTAKNGKKFVGTKKIKYGGNDYVYYTQTNLIEMYKNVQNIKNQKKLFIGGVCPWEVEQEEPVAVIAQQKKV